MTLKRRGFICGGAALGLALASPAFAQSSRRPRRKPAPSPEALFAQAGLPGAVLGFAAIDLATGGLVTGTGAGRVLPPASTLKTVTALYALDRLGPGHRFVTRVFRDGDTLVLAGGGDPTLDSDGLAALAADTAAAVGDWRPARFAVWGGALPEVPEIAPGQAAHLAYNPTVSGIILNFNRVYLGWRCEDSCALSLEARGRQHSPRAYTISAGTRPGGGTFGHAAGDGREHWDIPRAVLGRGSGARWLPVRRPEAYAGDVFQTLARAAGLPLPAPELAEAPPRGEVIARRESAALPAVLAGMLKHSTNLTAEVVGLAASGAATLEQSAQAMSGWLDSTGAGAARLADHSGMSGENRISAETLARLLARPEARAALRPLLNEDPLREVLGDTSRGSGKDGAPLVSAKTGTLNFVSTLAGYAENPGGVEVSFATLVADEDRWAATAGQDWPEGSIRWVQRAKKLQRDLASVSVEGLGAPAYLPAEI